MNRPMPRPMAYQSNASLGKNAKAASEGAYQLTDKAKDGDAESHNIAANAHYEASYQQKQAGNGTKAQEHLKQATVHSEKANAAYRAGSFADEEGRAAEALSKKAHLSEYGQDPKDARSHDELHKDAAEAHDRASKAFKMAKKDRESQYHAKKAEEHRQCCGGSSASSASSAS